MSLYVLPTAKWRAPPPPSLTPPVRARPPLLSVAESIEAALQLWGLPLERGGDEVRSLTVDPDWGHPRRLSRKTEGEAHGQPRPAEQRGLVEVLESRSVEADATLALAQRGNPTQLEAEVDRAGCPHDRRPKSGT